MAERKRRPAGWRVLVLGAAPLLFAPLLFAAPLAANAPAPTAQRWDSRAATELLAYVDRIGTHGLEPADYAPDELRAALRAGDGAEIDRRADETFERVARDLANGHVPPALRRRFHISAGAVPPERIARLAEEALASGDIASTLDDLAPGNRQYRALRAALLKLPPDAEAERRKIGINLERWRWMPRQLGARYLLANVPEYRVRLIDNGTEIASHRIIVGKLQTPTPQISARVEAVILNPSWYVPRSIVAESVGRLVRTSPQTARARGYTWTYAGGALQVTQKPGPQNALGQMKLDMPNAFSIYLHDTPNKDLFDRAERTFSHGCIRTDKPFDLAALLLAGTGWDRPLIDEAVESRKTTRVPLARPVPAYVVYLTAYAGADGSVNYFDDPYSLDEEIARLLHDRTGA